MSLISRCNWSPARRKFEIFSRQRSKRPPEGILENAVQGSNTARNKCSRWLGGGLNGFLDGRLCGGLSSWLGGGLSSWLGGGLSSWLGGGLSSWLGGGLGGGLSSWLSGGSGVGLAVGSAVGQRWARQFISGLLGNKHSSGLRSFLGSWLSGGLSSWLGGGLSGFLGGKFVEQTSTVPSPIFAVGLQSYPLFFSAKDLYFCCKLLEHTCAYIEGFRVATSLLLLC